MIVTSVLGKETGVALDNLRPLTAARAYAGFGCAMPPLSREALMLSAELVAATYAMEVQDWLHAGWQDVTAQVERDVYPLTTANDAGAREKMTGGLRQWLTQTLVRFPNPLGDVAGALRQINHESDTGKALVMAHPLAEGRYLIAICFMGTTAHFYDWISNLRMDVQDGMHRGFLQLTKQFEGNETRISFPAAARTLGMKSLTLADVVAEARREDSRFLLWVTGHSQGGALTQLYIHRKMTESGVLAQNILGYAFASPSVAIRGVVEDPGACPVFLVENNEDAVPRSGAQVHLGQRLVYRADEGLRRNCYTWPRDAESVRARRLVRPFVAGMRDMPTILILVDAYLSELIALPASEIVDALGAEVINKSPLRHLMGAADVGVDGMLGYLRTRLEAAYRTITGADIPAHAVKNHQTNMHHIMRVVGVKPFTLAMSQLLGQPHTSRKRGKAAYGAYPYIACAGLDKLVRVTWRSGEVVRSDRAGEMLIVRRTERAERVRTPRLPRSRTPR